MIKPYREINPAINETCFIAENASVIGNVRIGSKSSVWFGAVIRGDEDGIDIGENSNIQDNAVLHCDVGHPIKIGDFVTVGHGAIVHGATVGDNVLVGMGAVIMNGVEIGANSMIGAGAVCTENMVIPNGSVVVGIPAKIIKNAEEQNKSLTMLNACGYVLLGEEYAENS
jgi:carbonic anhydrase/acetyltransferase-like protein (isoleucine patch superfamily)